MQVAPVAHIRTCFKEKFGTPRQSGIVKAAWGELVFEPGYRNPDMLRGLEGFSHLWIIFLFHKSLSQGWRPTVRPPRLGGNERVGVWASRSPFRPNPIGLSVVKLESVNESASESPIITVSGPDLVDGTPVLDIKPYIPYADSVPRAIGGFAESAPEKISVFLSENLASTLPKGMPDLIVQTLSADPRPAYHDDPERIYGLLLDCYNIKWKKDRNGIRVISAEKV